jgi:hypothetical protein
VRRRKERQRNERKGKERSGAKKSVGEDREKGLRDPVKSGETR